MGCLLLLMQQLTNVGVDSGLLPRVDAALGNPQPRAMLAYLAIAVFLVFALKAVFALLFRRWMLRFVAAQEIEMSYRLLIGYLHGPYWKVLQRSTGDLVRTMYDSTSALYGGVVAPIIQVGVEGLTVAAVIVFLLVVMPIPTLSALALFGTASWVLNRFVKRWAQHVGEVQVAAGGRAWRATLQALSGIKEIKVRRTEEHFLAEFYRSRTEWGRARATSSFLAELPNYVLEVFFIAGVLMVIGLVSLTSPSGQTMPLIAVFVAAGLRLLPSVVRTLSAVNSIRISLPHMTVVVDELIGELATSTAWFGRDPADVHDRMPLRRELELRDLYFRYPLSDTDVIKGVDLRIPVGHALAFAGASGAGKSTLVDLVLGLHTPTSGEILVDGERIHSNVAAWQRTVGLVPQDVFLLDESLRNNVTLGLEADEERLRAVLAQAQLDELVGSLPDGVDTKLGERGSRVSGGQRQRIGIARRPLHPAIRADPRRGDLCSRQ